jgi:hypothetical protein
MGGGGGKIVKIDSVLVNFQLQAFYNVERIEYAPEWALHFQIQLLFPK